MDFETWYPLILKTAITGCGITGLYILVKSLQLTQCYTDANQIAPEFLAHQIMFRGVLTNVFDGGDNNIYLSIRHIPVFTMHNALLHIAQFIKFVQSKGLISALFDSTAFKKHTILSEDCDDNNLTLSLWGLTANHLDTNAMTYLKQHYLNHYIYFQLLTNEKQGTNTVEHTPCILYNYAKVKQFNKLLLELGLARVNDNQLQAHLIASPSIIGHNNNKQEMMEFIHCIRAYYDMTYCNPNTIKNDKKRLFSIPPYLWNHYKLHYEQRIALGLYASQNKAQRRKIGFWKEEQSTNHNKMYKIKNLLRSSSKIKDTSNLPMSSGFKSFIQKILLKF